MDALVFAVVLLALAVYVARPLYSAAPAGTPPQETELTARRESLINELRELEWDLASGLMDREEYHRRKEAVEAAAAEAWQRAAGLPDDR